MEMEKLPVNCDNEDDVIHGDWLFILMRRHVMPTARRSGASHGICMFHRLSTALGCSVVL